MIACQRTAKRSVDLMEQKAIKVNGQYKLSLPPKDEVIRLPINRGDAIKWLQSLEECLIRMIHFQRTQEVYGRTDRDRICKYASKFDSKTPGGETWYVPFQGVLNPNKGKIYVIYDCNSQYRGTSMNEYLTSIINKLVNVLMSLRVGPIAFMTDTDIQGMFYQVKIQEKQR